jgi:putative transposase
MALRGGIKAVAAEWPTCGYRRVTEQLRRQECLVNHKRAQRLMRLTDIQAKTKRRKRRTTNSEHDFPRYPNLVQDLEIVQPEQVWVSDSTYVHLPHDFVYLAVIMGVFTRGIRGWHLGRSLDHAWILTALQRGLANHPAPKIHHSGQGVQYPATVYTQALQDVNVQISMADVGEAWQNGYAERLIRMIKEEEVDLSGYIGYNDAYRQFGHFLVEEVEERERVAVCYDLLRQTYHRARIPLADRSLFEAAFDVLYPRGMVKFWLARIDDTCVGASVE